LRLLHLNSGLWHDEIGTLVTYVRLPWGHTLTDMSSHNNHMFYTLLAQGVIALVGESAWSLRLPAVVLGVGSIGALFLFAARVANVREALAACLLMSVSYHHIWFSQNARGYTGLLMFTLLVTWFWLEALPRNDFRWWIGYVICVALGAWIHMTMVFVVASHCLIYLLLLGCEIWRRRSSEARPITRLANWWMPGVAFFLCLTATLQLYALALPNYLTSGLSQLTVDAVSFDPLRLIIESVRGLRAAFPPSMQVLGLIALLFGTAMLTAGWTSYLRRDWIAAASMILPGVLIIVVTYAMRHNLWPRFLFFCAGFGILVATRGAFELPKWGFACFARSPKMDRLVPVAGSLLFMLMVVVSVMSLPKNYAYPKQDYLGALEFVEHVTHPREIVVTAGLARVAYSRLYAPHWLAIENANELEQLRQKHAAVWLVVSVPNHLKRWHPDIWRAAQEDFELVRTFRGTLSGGEVFVYCDRRPHSTAETMANVTAIDRRVTCAPQI
jgi:uncharacterized membrane protein